MKLFDIFIAIWNAFVVVFSKPEVFDVDRLAEDWYDHQKKHYEFFRSKHREHLDLPFTDVRTGPTRVGPYPLIHWSENGQHMFCQGEGMVEHIRHYFSKELVRTNKLSHYYGQDYIVEEAIVPKNPFKESRDKFTMTIKVPEYEHYPEHRMIITVWKNYGDFTSNRTTLNLIRYPHDESGDSHIYNSLIDD